MKRGLGDNPMNALLLGGCSMVLAGACVSLVSKDVDAASASASATVPVSAGNCT